MSAQDILQDAYNDFKENAHELKVFLVIHYFKIYFPDIGWMPFLKPEIC
jgi:hypothetical protein